MAQLHKEGNNPGWKAVHHKSRSLIPAEENYTKPEGESLAIYSGIKMNQQYLYGTPFTVMTDHSALPNLYNTNRQAPTRVERHKGRLGSFQFRVQYVPGTQHPCDYGSRHPDPVPENLTKKEMEDMGIEKEEADQEIWVSRMVQTAIPAITLEAMKGATAMDPELAKILEEKRTGRKSSATSKGPWGKIWDEVRERDGILLRKDQEDKQDRLVVPKALQAQAIAIAHEGHQQTDGTLRMLRQTQWFRNMRQAVKEYVESCRCQTANPANPTPPMKLKPLPQAPWKITAVDYKGLIGIGRNKVYLHTQMDAYSRYPVVHILKTTRIGELKKALGHTIRTHGRPDEIWSDGGPPYNSHEWVRWVKEWGVKPKKTTPYHPPANGMVERFNRNLKLVIHAAFATGQDLEEEVDKYVAAYRSTPHAVTGATPNKLMFNREVTTKLPQITRTPQGQHHQEARRRDREAKQAAKTRYDKKHRARQQDIKEGDLAYRRRTQQTSTKGPWEPTPFKITEVIHNKITGTRQSTTSTRDRGDWKVVKGRPAHLQLPHDIQRAINGTLPSIAENVFDEGDLDDLDDYVPDRPVTRSARTREYGDAPPANNVTREDDLPSTAGDEVRSGIGENAPETTQQDDLPPAIR